MLKTIAETLKGSPACLAAIVLAGVYAAMTYYEQERMHQRFLQFMQQHCLTVSPPPQ